MTYQESDKIRRLCMKHSIRFYVAKDRDSNYSVQLYGRQSCDHWNTANFRTASQAIEFIVSKRSMPFSMN